jgi:hypothetical protein
MSALFALLIALPLQAAAPAPPPRPQPRDCHDAAHGQYDFFIGDWEVSDSRSGKHVAHSRIEKIMDGCAIRESFDQDVGPAGTQVDYHGTSYTAFNTGDGTWRQFYTDTKGAAFSYTGGIEQRAMVLTAFGGQLGNRLIVAPQPDGSVRQSGVVSTDGGKTWSAPGYDFTYRRR